MLTHDVKIFLKTNTGFNINKGEILSCGMTPNSNEQVPEVSEPVTTSAPQSPVESQESEIPITSFCDVNDLNAHFKNSNLRFNCGKKTCTGRVYFDLSLIESNFTNFQPSSNAIIDKPMQLNVLMEIPDGVFQKHQK